MNVARYGPDLEYSLKTGPRELADRSYLRMSAGNFENSYSLSIYFCETR